MGFRLYSFVILIKKILLQNQNQNQNQNQKNKIKKTKSKKPNRKGKVRKTVGFLTDYINEMVDKLIG